MNSIEFQKRGNKCQIAKTHLAARKKEMEILAAVHLAVAQIHAAQIMHANATAAAAKNHLLAMTITAAKNHLLAMTMQKKCLSSLTWPGWRF
jgi:hypothetical protein